MRKAFALPTVAIAAAAFPLLTMTAASAHAASSSYQADLSALNESGVTGTGMVTLDGTSATVTIEATGLVEGAPHAQHFHFGAQGACPTDAAKTAASVRWSSQRRTHRFGAEPSDFRPVAPERTIWTNVRSIRGESTTRSKTRSISAGSHRESIATSSAGMSFMKARSRL